VARHLRPILAGLLGVYVLGYGVARVSIFHAVERYGGPEGKGGPRRDFITRRDRPPGDGWEYGLFLPAIRMEEAVLASIRNREPVNPLDLLIDLHRDGERQGPGGDAETELALQLAGVDRSAPLRLADIGCGTGASTLLLARLLRHARITAVDLLPEFLAVLEGRARQQGVADAITSCAASMDSLPFAEGELDVIWSEAAIYNIGFAKGIAAWRRFLKPGGLLVVSEITWTTASRPADLQRHWQTEYPDIDLASTKIGQLEQHGYAPIGYAVLPQHCWLDHYYRPLQARFDAFLSRHGHSEAARAIVIDEEREIQLYDSHKAHFGYGMYVARRLG
jgi:SAM-dependent methyltransferase